MVKQRLCCHCVALHLMTLTAPQCWWCMIRVTKTIIVSCPDLTSKGHKAWKINSYPTVRSQQITHIYYTFVLWTECSQVVLLSRNCTLDVYTKTKYNCPLSFPPRPLPCWMIVVPLRLPVAVQCTGASANGGIPWWCVWIGSPVRLHHVATATANITPCHKVLHMCGILLC